MQIQIDLKWETLYEGLKDQVGYIKMHHGSKAEKFTDVI